MPPLARIGAAAFNATLAGMERVRRPKLSGRLRVGGLVGDVEVLRDRWGVPHVYASSLSDLLFAQGFVHAQDRLWQMEFQRRLVAGRLAEILGPSVVPVDRATRTIGMYRVAEAEVGMLTATGRAEVEAYAAGVNACLVLQPLPVEFALLRYRPEPWKPADSLCWAKMMSWSLSVNWETELLRARLIEVLGSEMAAELEPLMTGPIVMENGTAGPIDARGSNRSAARPGATHAHAPVESTGPSRVHGDPDAEALRSTGGMPGSNNWVIAGSRTATGKPILANDMHLLMSAPAIWYEMHLVGTHPDEGVDVTGVSLPGVPYVIAGHNGCVAWGFTNGFPDVEDLFIERLRRTATGVEYEYRGTWWPAEVRREEIRVKGAATVVQEVIVTRHGPVINQLAPGLASAPGQDGLPGEPLALRWTSLDPHLMVEALRAMNRARSCREFREATRGWIAPVQNMVCADTAGNIAYVFPGHVPVRGKGDGRVPVPGWTGEYDWTGWIPFEALPCRENPEAGFIVSANNRVVDERYPYYIGREFALGDRAERIAALIQANPKITVSDVRMIQLDQESLSLRELAGYVGALDAKEPELASLVTLVKGWDGRLSADSPAAAVLEVFGRLVQLVVMEAKLGRIAFEGDDVPLLDRVMGKGPTPGIQEASFFYHRMWEWLYAVLPDAGAHWWDLGHGETREDVLRTALQRTYSYLVSRLGEPDLPGYSNWGWGRLHMVTFGHMVGRAPALSQHFNRGPYPIGGDGNTVFATGGGLTLEASTAVVGPPFRFIADLSDLGRCYGLLAPGNSGRPDSPHYDDQIEAWFKGQYHPMLYRREDVQRGTRRRLVLAASEAPQKHNAGRNKQGGGDAGRPISGLKQHTGQQ